MYNNKLKFFIKSAFLKSKKNMFLDFKKSKQKYFYLFKSYKNNNKKIITNLCFHQNKYKTVNNFCKMNRHELLFKITFN